VELNSPQKPSASPTGAPKQSRNATSSGNRWRASASIECEPRASKGRTPAGKTIHNSTAKAKPQINPAPVLVARFAKSKPKAAPNKSPHSDDCASERPRIIPCSAPPDAPTDNPRRTSFVCTDNPLAFDSSCTIIAA